MSVVAVCGNMEKYKDEIMDYIDELAMDFEVLFSGSNDSEKRIRRIMTIADSLYVYNKDLCLDKSSLLYIRYAKIYNKNIIYKESALPIVTLCGSGKFKSTFKSVEMKLLSEGKIVFCPSIFNFPDPSILSPEMHETLDRIHREKINISDIIYIINKDGYIGNDTREEIKYADSIGKKIIYLEGEDPYAGNN